MEDMRVRDLPIKSTVLPTDYILLEDFEGTKLAKVNDIAEAVSTKLYFGSFEEMVNCNTLKEWDICVTLGYHSPNDGGNAMYIIMNNPAIREDKIRVNYVNTSDTLRAFMIIGADQTINIHQVGAYGDGIHDDFECISKALNSGLNVVFGKNKEYYVSDKITIDNTISKTGVNIDFNNSTLVASGKFSPILSICNIKGMDTSCDTHTDNYRIYINNINNIKIKNTTDAILNSIIMISLSGGNISLSNIHLTLPRNGIRFTGINIESGTSKSVILNDIDINTEFVTMTEDQYFDLIEYEIENGLPVPAIGGEYSSDRISYWKPFNDTYTTDVGRGIGICITCVSINETDYRGINHIANAEVVLNNIHMANVGTGIEIYNLFFGTGKAAKVEINNFTYLQPYTFSMGGVCRIYNSDRNVVEKTWQGPGYPIIRKINENDGVGIYIDSKYRNNINIDIDGAYCTNATAFLKTSDQYQNTFNDDKKAYTAEISIKDLYCENNCAICDDSNSVNNSYVNFTIPINERTITAELDRYRTGYVFDIRHLQSKMPMYLTLSGYQKYVNMTEDVYCLRIFNNNSVVVFNNSDIKTIGNVITGFGNEEYKYPDSLPERPTIVDSFNTLNSPVVSLNDDFYPTPGEFIDISSINTRGSMNVYFQSSRSYSIRYIGVVSPWIDKDNSKLLNNYDRQIINLTGPSSLSIEDSSSTPKAGSMCTIGDGNIKLKSGAKLSLDPIRPITLQFSLADNAWYEI